METNPVVYRLERVTLWLAHNIDEMKKNHPADYIVFVGLINELQTQAERLDRMHAKGDN